MSATATGTGLKRLQHILIEARDGSSRRAGTMGREQPIVLESAPSGALGPLPT